MKKLTTRNAWAWIPSLYFAEGLPYVVVMTVSVIMYKRLGLSNTDIALYTSWLYLPWVIKPIWSPLVDNLRTKRFWIVSMQLLVGVPAGVAFTIPASNFVQYSLAFLWLMHSVQQHTTLLPMAFTCSDFRNKNRLFLLDPKYFYRFAMLAGQGPLNYLAGYLESTSNELSGHGA